ncbi:MAG: hypothetical protein LBT65_07400 [Synergistaceae bacterium]|nr:hypothetical protein [Synergistaceae bacterium]
MNRISIIAPGVRDMARPSIASLATGDACTGSNPRPITPAEMEKLFSCIYDGRPVDF